MVLWAKEMVQLVKAPATKSNNWLDLEDLHGERRVPQVATQGLWQNTHTHKKIFLMFLKKKSGLVF